MLVALLGGLGASSLRKDCDGFADSRREGDQLTLYESICDRQQKPPTEEGFIIGYGGYMNMVNGSPFDWVTSSTHSYQMDTWNWPAVSAGRASE